MVEQTINSENSQLNNKDNVDKVSATETNADNIASNDSNNHKENNGGNESIHITYEYSKLDRVINIVSTTAFIACTIAIGIFNMRSSK